VAVLVARSEFIEQTSSSFNLQVDFHSPLRSQIMHTESAALPGHGMVGIARIIVTPDSSILSSPTSRVSPCGKVFVATIPTIESFSQSWMALRIK
jgi:hypothetical protein